MMATKLLLAGIFLLGQYMWAAEIRELSVKFASRCESPPAIDGVLGEECWKFAPAYTSYKPRRGDKKTSAGDVQRTELKILWDDAGLYLGITNFERNVATLRTQAKIRNSGWIWADDCAELYLDPSATGAGHYKFDVNSIGAIGDQWEVDPGFTDTQWSAVSARAAGTSGEGYWTIEFFVAWDDLKKKPEAGDVWSFFHRRLSWAGGSLEDSSTTGDSYPTRHEGFSRGFLIFIEREPPPAMDLARTLLKYTEPDWLLKYGGDWIWARGGDQVSVAGEKDIVSHFRVAAEAAIGVLAKTGGGERPGLTEKLAELRESVKRAEGLDCLAAVDAYNAVAKEVESLKMRILLEDFLSQ